MAVDTLYPFGSTLKYTIEATKPFTFSIRVPTYAQGGKGSTIAAGKSGPAPLTFDGSSLHAVKVRMKVMMKHDCDT